jgi:hypothetical protein
MYQVLDPRKTTELYLTRQGWFSREYELTDNVYSYGQLAYRRLSRRKAIVTTATDSWTFQIESVFSRTILIMDQNGEIIGKATRGLFSRRILLTMNNGFQGEFYRPSIWLREYVWESGEYGKIMHIHSNPFSLMDLVGINQSMAPAALIPLLTFLGSYLIILRRRRKAGH